METKLQPQTFAKAVEVDANNVFAIVLVPQTLLDVEICGRKTSAWVENAVSAFQSRIVEIKKGQDIITIVKDNVIQKKYCVVVYADTPLLTPDTIGQALTFVSTYGHKAGQMPRGWVFEIEYVKIAPTIQSVVIPNLEETDFTVAYNFAQIALITTYMRTRINDAHMAAGVHITDPYCTYIDADVKIGAGTRIGPGAYIAGAHIGKNCDIGCGVVFCDYDGKEKHKITVGDNVFVGANSNLVAPLIIGHHAYIAPGSTITNDVPADALALARARQAVKENYKQLKDES